MASNHEIESGTDKKVDAVKGVNTGSDASGRLSAQYMDSLFSKDNDGTANKAGDTRQNAAFAGELHPLSIENTAGAKPTVERTAAVQEQPKAQPGKAPEEQPKVQPAKAPEQHAPPQARPEAHPQSQPQARPEVHPQAQPQARPEVHPQVSPKPEVQPQQKPEAQPGNGNRRETLKPGTQPGSQNPESQPFGLHQGTGNRGIETQPQPNQLGNPKGSQPEGQLQPGNQNGRQPERQVQPGNQQQQPGRENFPGRIHPMGEGPLQWQPNLEQWYQPGMDWQGMPAVLPADVLPPLQVAPDVQPQPQQQPLEVTPAPQGPQPDGAAPGMLHVGAHDYQIALGPDGQTNTLNFASPDGASALQLTRDASGNLMVANATGDFQPKNGVITFEGIPIFVGPDGKVNGDVVFDSKGDVKYKTANGPDQKEYDRMANGTIKMTDFKNWEQTTITADGHAITNYWDGYEWREGQPSPDGKRIDFMPQDPTKPASISRDTSNGQNLTQIAWADGTNFNCDWNKQMIVEQIPPGSDGTPAQTVNLYYNGSTFQPAQQVTPDQPNPGDTTVAFQDAQAGDPASAVLHADGGVTSIYADNTMVDKNPDGYVKSISGPKGNWLFMQDVNGDVEKFQHSYTGADGKPQTDTYSRNSAEQNPGMNYWFSRFGNNVPRPPDVLPPSDPNNPSGYDTYVDEHGNVVSMNLNVTADGTVRISQKGQDGKPAISFQPPVDAPPPQQQQQQQQDAPPPPQQQQQQQQQQQDAPPPAPQDNTNPQTTDGTNS